MKKVSLLFLCAFISPAFATGIGTGTTSAPCDNATLSKYNGTADIEINWEPNTIGLTWYDGDTQLNVPTASQTCTYDGMITVPPTPQQKPGYTFNGWKIPKIDFSTIPTNVNGTFGWAISWYNNARYCWYNTTQNTQTVNCDSDNTYNELQNYEWKIHFEHGDLYGITECNTTNGTYGQTGTPTSETGHYCWCKAKGYKATNTNLLMGALPVLYWIYMTEYSSLTECAKRCAFSCTYNIMASSYIRTALFTPAQ